MLCAASTLSCAHYTTLFVTLRDKLLVDDTKNVKTRELEKLSI